MQKIIQKFILQDWSNKASSTTTPENEGIVSPECLSEEVHLASIESTITQDPILPNTTITVNYSIEELEAAKLSAYTEGYNYAKQELILEQEQSLKNILTKISEQFDLILLNQAEYSKTQSNLINKIALQIAKKVIGEIKNKKSIERIAKFVEEALEIISTPSNLVLCINSANHEAVSKKLSHLTVKDGQKWIEIVIDNNVLEGNCIVKWPQGHMEYNEDKILQKIENILLKAR